MSRASGIVESLRSTLSLIDEVCSPSEADEIYAALVAHLRGRRPESVAPLGELPPPTQPIRDPRGA